MYIYILTYLAPAFCGYNGSHFGPVLYDIQTTPLSVIVNCIYFLLSETLHPSPSHTFPYPHNQSTPLPPPPQLCPPISYYTSYRLSWNKKKKIEMKIDKT